MTNKQQIYRVTISDRTTSCLVYFMTSETTVLEAIFILSKFLVSNLELNFVIPIITETQLVYNYEGPRKDISISIENIFILILDISIHGVKSVNIQKYIHEYIHNLRQLELPFDILEGTLYDR